MKSIFKLSAMLSALGATLPLQAKPYVTPDTWGGDLASRPRLTGAWGGMRHAMAGKDVVPGRPHDDFGIGWACTEFSDDFVPFLRGTFDLGLDHEDVVELYYNTAAHPG